MAAQVADEVTGRSVLDFLMDNMTPEGSVLVTDEVRLYRAVRPYMSHAVIKHKERYVDGLIHTNTIEGFWSLLKRAWYGQHHAYRRQYTPLYVAEAAWKYNHRYSGGFSTFLEGCFA